MSDIIKLNIKSKNLKAIITDHKSISDGFIELPEVIEKEKREHAHKIEIENEYRKGYDTGKKETSKFLEEKHSEELLSQSKDFYKIIASFEEKIKIFENNYHSLVLEVSKKISEKILQKEIEIDPIIENILDIF